MTTHKLQPIRDLVARVIALSRGENTTIVHFRVADRLLSEMRQLGAWLPGDPDPKRAAVDALIELVAVKDLKEQTLTVSLEENRASVLVDYIERKPKAWERARSVLASLSS